MPTMAAQVGMTVRTELMGVLAVALDGTVAVVAVDGVFMVRRHNTGSSHILQSPTEVLTRRAVITLSLASAFLSGLPSLRTTVQFPCFDS